MVEVGHTILVGRVQIEVFGVERRDIARRVALLVVRLERDL